MPILKTQYLYEVLFRFGPNGLQGSHSIDLVSVDDTDTGENINQTLTPAIPITAETAKELVGERAAMLVEQIADLQGRLKQATQIISDQVDAMKAMDAALAKMPPAPVDAVNPDAG